MNRLLPLRIPLRQISYKHGDWDKCLPKPNYGPMEVQRSSLMNGIKIAVSKPLGSLMGACTIMYQAGSRYEVDDSLGANHFLRIASSSSGQAHSAFAKSRILQQHGASLTCTNDRQFIAFTLRCPVPLFPKLKTFLMDTAVRCSYKDWEIKDLKAVVWDSLHRIHPEQRVIDLVQRACWAGPLTNSIFCEPQRIGSMSGKILAQYASENFKTNKCTVASMGIPFEEIMKFAEMIESNRDRPEEQSTKCSFSRRGYEVEDLGPNSSTWIAVVVPGCGTCDPRCLLLHNIVAAACGTGHNQMGQHSQDRTLATPLGIMSGEDVYTSYKAFNISYKDTGVFGIVAKTRPCSAWNVALAASEFLTHVCDLSFKQIEIGKLRLKLGLALIDEDCVKLTEGLALQLDTNIQIDRAADAMFMVDSCTPDEVSCVAQILSKKSAQMAMAVVGDVTSVPHDREIIRNF